MDAEVLSWPLWTAAAGALFLAGVTQGALGFGFPTISTPILVLLTDVKTAIILNLLPNFTVNFISMVRGGNWGASPATYNRMLRHVLSAIALVLAWQGARYFVR